MLRISIARARLFGGREGACEPRGWDQSQRENGGDISAVLSAKEVRWSADGREVSRVEHGQEGACEAGDAWGGSFSQTLWAGLQGKTEWTT